MSSKTKIVVLHMKEIIYTVLFICLGILLVALLTFMFHPKNKETSSSKSTSYQPGIYTSQLTLGDKELEVEVTVDENHINSIRFSNLDDNRHHHVSVDPADYGRNRRPDLPDTIARKHFLFLRQSIYPLKSSSTPLMMP